MSGDGHTSRMQKCTHTRGLTCGVAFLPKKAATKLIRTIKNACGEELFRLGYPRSQKIRRRLKKDWSWKGGLITMLPSSTPIVAMRDRPKHPDTYAQ